MEYQQLIESLTPEVYQQLKLAVELGKWPDGRRLSPEQRQECLQAIIAWSRLNLPEHEQVGYIVQGR
ncbi:MAG: YeaC family protein [Parahaliea sp.]